MSQPSNSAVRGSPSSSAASAPPPAAATGDYVVNLCASTTPMALAKPTAPELARYTFFVSRRREEGRERFRLHMGYFASREDAEQMLLLVRDLYPAAWVGETPGRKLAASPAARVSAPVAPASVSERPAAAATALPAPSPPETRSAPVPTACANEPPALSREAAPSPVMTSAVEPPRDQVAEPAAAAVARGTAVPAVKVPPASNVREVIAALEPDVSAPTAAPRVAAGAAPVKSSASPTPASPAPARVSSPAPAAAVSFASPAPAPRVAPPPAAAAAAPSRPAAPVAPPVAAKPPLAQPPAPTAAAAAAAVPSVRSTSPGADMSDSQVLRVLEGRSNAAQDRAAAGTPDPRDIALLSPQDTQTWRDIKAQIKRDAVVHFAVQLNWSVTPIDLARVPSLAIFNAYTLYKIEGNRDGRKWYGLRLGFFSDAVSAKQVAHYVRSEFAQVAVVPVGVNEREQAKQIGAIALPAATPAPRAAPAAAADGEFKLIDDDTPPPRSATAAFDDVPADVDLPPAAPAATRAPASKARRPNRPRGAPQSLEETLEILGASQLSIDSGRGERVVRDGRPRGHEAWSATVVRLLDRLGEKLRK
jgi:hypothetical protein